jgi:acyl dehydratase
MTQPGTMANGLFLEDLRVGQRFSSGEHTIDAAQIMAFAAQFDPQPFHLDGEAATATLFGGLAASGWHTAAITMKLLVESGLPLGGGIIGSGGEISWPKPTRPGDTLSVVSEIKEVNPVTLAAGSRHDPRAQRDAQPAGRDAADSHSEACCSQTHDRCACDLTAALGCYYFDHQLCADAACPA